MGNFFGQLLKFQLLFDPDCKIPIPASQAEDGFKGVIINHAGVNRGQDLPEFRQGPAFQSGWDRGNPRLHEMERLLVDYPGDDLEMGKMIFDDGNDRRPQGFQVHEFIRVEDPELFSQNPVPHLNSGPGGKIVRVGPGNVFVPEEKAMSVLINGVEGNFLNGIQKLPFVAGAPSQHLPEFPAASE